MKDCLQESSNSSSSYHGGDGTSMLSIACSSISLSVVMDVCTAVCWEHFITTLREIEGTINGERWSGCIASSIQLHLSSADIWDPTGEVIISISNLLFLTNIISDVPLRNQFSSSSNFNLRRKCRVRFYELKYEILQDQL